MKTRWKIAIIGLIILLFFLILFGEKIWGFFEEVMMTLDDIKNNRMGIMGPELKNL